MCHTLYCDVICFLGHTWTFVRRSIRYIGVIMGAPRDSGNIIALIHVLYTDTETAVRYDGHIWILDLPTGVSKDVSSLRPCSAFVWTE